MAFAAAIWVLWTIISRPTNCGGNSAALSQVRSIALTLLVAANEAPSCSFSILAPNSEQRSQLSALSRSHWISEANFLVSTNVFLEPEPRPKRMVAICDRPYSNVPRRWIGSAPLSHAVGFADGSGGLISQREFAALDLSTFVRLDWLFLREPE